MSGLCIYIPLAICYVVVSCIKKMGFTPGTFSDSKFCDKLTNYLSFRTIDFAIDRITMTVIIEPLVPYNQVYITTASEPRGTVNVLQLAFMRT